MTKNILGIFLAAQLILVLVVWGLGQQEVEAPQSFLSFDSATIDKLSISDGETSVELVRNGDEWKFGDEPGRLQLPISIWEHLQASERFMLGMSKEVPYIPLIFRTTKLGWQRAIGWTKGYSVHRAALQVWRGRDGLLLRNKTVPGVRGVTI